MTEMADRYRRRADAFEALIEGTSTERWSSPSPCEGWRARDVVAHVVDYSGLVLREQAGLSEVPVFAEFDDPAAAFRSIRKIIERVLDDPETPRKVATHVEWSLSFDLPQHGWDLAVATGQDRPSTPEVELLWGSLNGDPELGMAARQRVVRDARRRPSGRASPGPRPRADRARSGVEATSLNRADRVRLAFGRRAAERPCRRPDAVQLFHVRKPWSGEHARLHR